MRIVGILAIVCAIPFFVAWLRAGPAQRRLAYFGIGLLPFVSGALNLDVALVDWSMWPGYTKGLIVTLVDALALAVVLTHRIVRPPTALVVAFGAYCLVVAASAFAAGAWMASMFYVFQLARMFLVILAVSSIAAQPGSLQPLMSGLALGMMVQAASAISEKIGGAVQASGTMGHQNLLGMMSHFVLFPLAGMMLANKGGKLVASGVISCMLVIALGASRASIGLSAAGLTTLLILSAVRRMTPHKLRIVGVGVIALAVVVPLAAVSFSTRLETRANDGSDEARASMERAAHMIIADHPFGVGANQYVVVANMDGYSERAGVIWNAGSRSAHVHNFYLLTQAELGWAGIAVVVALLGSALVLAVKFTWSDRRDPRGEITLGISVAIAVVCVHNLYEWIFITTDVEYLFAIGIGIVSGLIALRHRERRARLRRARTHATTGLTEISIGSVS